MRFANFTCALKKVYVICEKKLSENKYILKANSNFDFAAPDVIRDEKLKIGILQFQFTETKPGAARFSFITALSTSMSAPLPLLSLPFGDAIYHGKKWSWYATAPPGCVDWAHEKSNDAQFNRMRTWYYYLVLGNQRPSPAGPSKQ